MKRRVICRSAAAKQLAREVGVHDPVAAVRLRGSALIATLAGPPFKVDAPAILNATNIRAIRELTNSSLDGRIFRGDAGYIIELNRRLGPARRAFTLAHEIAHTFFLNTVGLGERTDSTTGQFDQGNEEEYLCDVAAAEMLMPAAAFIHQGVSPQIPDWFAAKNAFLKRVFDYGPSILSVLNLSKEFGTSLTATARRFAELTKENVYIGFWRVTPVRTIEFDYGFSSTHIDWRIARAFTPDPSTPVSQALTAEELSEGLGELGFANSRGNRADPVLTQAIYLQSTNRVISISLFNDAERRRPPPATTGQGRLAFDR